MFDESAFGGPAPMPIDSYMNDGGARNTSDQDLLPTGDEFNATESLTLSNTARQQARQRKRARMATVQQEASDFLAEQPGAQRHQSAPHAANVEAPESDTDSYSDNSDYKLEGDGYEDISDADDDTQPVAGRLRPRQARVNVIAGERDKSVHQVTDRWSRGAGRFPSYANVLMLWISAACCMRSDIGITAHSAPACVVRKRKTATPDMPTWGSVKNRSDYPEWLKAWDTECNAMKKLGVLEECDEPYSKPVAGSTLVCKINKLRNGAIDKYRVRWVLEGFSQTYSVNFFAPHHLLFRPQS